MSRDRVLASASQRTKKGPEQALVPLPDPSVRPSPSSVKLSKTFYRRSGALFLRPHIALWTPHDHEIWSLYGPALLALVLEPVQAAVDSLVVSQLGIIPLGAVGFGTVIFQFIIGFFATFVFATTPRVAGLVADNDRSAALAATAHGYLVAFWVGLVLSIIIWLLVPDLVSLLSSDTQVASLAAEYLRARTWGIPAALIMMVGIGASRGHKDMTAPLIGSAAYGVALGFFDVIFVFGCGAGVGGAGVAAAISQWIGAAAITGWMIKNNEFDIQHLTKLPPVKAAQPYAAMAPSLAVNGIAALAPMLVATSLATKLGPDVLAAHTVTRQLSSFWLQSFLAFNATAHSLVAHSLGQQHRSSGMDRAASLLERICQVAVGTSLLVAAGCIVFRSALPRLITSDIVVVGEVTDVLPFLILCMPLDALGTSLEGGILGAADTGWVAYRTVVSSAVALGALVAAAAGHQGLLIIWICLKLLNFTALGLDIARFMGPAITRKSRK